MERAAVRAGVPGIRLGRPERRVPGTGVDMARIGVALRAGKFLRQLARQGPGHAAHISRCPGRAPAADADVRHATQTHDRWVWRKRVERLPAPGANTDLALSATGRAPASNRSVLLAQIRTSADLHTGVYPAMGRLRPGAWPEH